ncbi:MAG TPA: ABC transporter permease [Symbiobacteriaceae bacterium]|nr:ABC transporter permease [Symbiobacteriaceae bacterium]
MMLHLAWKNVKFRKMRALLTILGIASSISLVVLMTGIMTGTEKSFVDSFAQMAGEVRIQPKSDALSGTSTDLVPQGALLSPEAVRKITDAARGYDASRSSAVVYQPLIPASAPNMPDVMVLHGVEPGKEQVGLRGVAIAAGEGKLTGERDLIIGNGALTALGTRDGRTYTIGDEVSLQDGATFTIKGIAEKRDTFTDSLAIVPIKTAQTLLQRQDNVNFVVLNYPVDTVKETAAALEEQLPEFEVVTADAMLESVNKALDGQRTFFALINGTVYFTAVAIIFMVMYTAVMERTREIGTMRAVGTPRSAVVTGILSEAVILTLVGAILAAVPGYFIIVTGWAMLPAGQFLAEVARTFGAAVLIALGSCLYPAARAARINPLEALRYE